MSSAIWSIATMKKSILFDVLAVIDRANRITAKKTIFFEYSLLKKETVKKYDKIYKASVNRDDILMAALYAPVKKPREERFTVIYEYLIDLAFDMCSFADLIDWIKKSKRSDMAYYIAVKCLSTVENEVKTEDIANLVDVKDTEVINFLHTFSIPEKIKMSIYMMIYYYEDFVQTLIKYLNHVYELVLSLYDDLYYVFHAVEDMLTEKLKDKKQRYQLLSAFAKKVLMDDYVKSKHIIVISIVRLEYGWMKHTINSDFYIIGIFYIQRIIHDNQFVLF